MKINTFSTILAIISSSLSIFAQEISNVKSFQEGNSIIISYDITSNSADDLFFISLHYSVNRGSSFIHIFENLTGDIGEVKTGLNKRIKWDALKFQDPFIGKDIIFQIEAIKFGFLSDERDGKKYRYVKIGEQTWMAENLNFSFFINSPCYDNNKSNCKIFGCLYTYRNANKLCPTGWHLPNDDEFQELFDFLGGNEVAGGKLKATKGWSLPNNSASNVCGFSALPGGSGANEYFSGKGLNCFFWSSTSSLDNITGSSYIISNSTTTVSSYSNNKNAKLSVRCIKD